MERAAVNHVAGADTGDGAATEDVAVAEVSWKVAIDWMAAMVRGSLDGLVGTRELRTKSG